MCTVTQDMAPQTSEEIRERSPPEAYPAFVEVADNPKRPTNEYVLVCPIVPQSSLCVWICSLLCSSYLCVWICSFLCSSCSPPTVFSLAECRLSILFIVYHPAIILCLDCPKRQHDGRLWYVLLGLYNVTDQSIGRLTVCLMNQLDLTFFLTLYVYRISTTAAMYVDVVTYMFNFLAERLKHAHDSSISARALRLRRLYLELIPPTISVVTLLIVTVLALQKAFKSIFARENGDDAQAPDLNIMLAFSALNLLLDGVNVGCFARVDQTSRFIGDHHNSSQHSLDQATVATETTPLVESSELTLPPMHITMGSNNDGGVDNDVGEHDSQDSTDIPGGINLNMCSAFTVRYLLHKAFAWHAPTLQQHSYSFHCFSPSICSILPPILSEALLSCWPLALRLSFLHSSLPSTPTRMEQFWFRGLSW
jgi:hypothetical protein